MSKLREVAVRLQKFQRHIAPAWNADEIVMTSRCAINALFQSASINFAAVWPLAARAQPGDCVQRIGWLMSGDENDPLWQPHISAFTQALADLGWTDGCNVRMDSR